MLQVWQLKTKLVEKTEKLINYNQIFWHMMMMILELKEMLHMIIQIRELAWLQMLDGMHKVDTKNLWIQEEKLMVIEWNKIN